MRAQPLILVVEDDENDTLLIRRTLFKAGVLNPVQFVSNGKAALAYLNGSGLYANREEYPLPGLVLLDLKMPEMNGFEVLTWIRNHPQFKDLRVVALTSSKEIRDVNTAYHLGANSFLVKPFEFEQMDALFTTLKSQRIWSGETPDWQPSGRQLRAEPD